MQKVTIKTAIALSQLTLALSIGGCSRNAPETPVEAPHVQNVRPLVETPEEIIARLGYETALVNREIALIEKIIAKMENRTEKLRQEREEMGGRKL